MTRTTRSAKLVAGLSAAVALTVAAFGAPAVDAATYATVPQHHETLEIHSGAEPNNVSVRAIPGIQVVGAPAPFRIDDSSADVVAGPGCSVRVDESSRRPFLVCFMVNGTRFRVTAQLGDGRNVFTSLTGAPTIYRGGRHADLVTTGAGADRIIPGDASDAVSSGAGNDELVLDDAFVDHADCGEGADTVFGGVEAVKSCESGTYTPFNPFHL